MKCATRSGRMSYVGKVAAPGDWYDIIRNVIFIEAERGKHSQILPLRMSYLGSSNKFANLPVPNTGKTARTYSKI